MFYVSLFFLIKETSFRRVFFFFQAEDGIRDADVTGVQTCALPISAERVRAGARKDRGVVGWKEDRVKVSLGIDVACRADHRASLAGPDGEFLWSGWRFRTSPLDLEALWSKIPAGAEVQVVMEPTRNAWVPLQAWLEARGAVVVLVPPEQSADLRNYYNKHTKTDRLDSRVLARLPLLHPEGLESVTGPTPAIRSAGPCGVAPSWSRPVPRCSSASMPSWSCSARRGRMPSARATPRAPWSSWSVGQIHAPCAAWGADDSRTCWSRPVGEPGGNRRPTSSWLRPRRASSCGRTAGSTSTSSPPTSPRRSASPGPSARRSPRSRHASPRCSPPRTAVPRHRTTARPPHRRARATTSATWGSWPRCRASTASWEPGSWPASATSTASTAWPGIRS